MSEGLAKKPITFYVGDKSLFLEKEEKKLVSGKIKLLDFISLFSNPEDRYYAITVFEEKIPLVIKNRILRIFNFSISTFTIKTNRCIICLFVMIANSLLKRWRLLKD